MITASDMLKLSKDCAEYKVNTVYEDSNFKEHCLERIPQEAGEGKLVYSFSNVQKILKELEPMLLDKFMSVIKEFEYNGFKVLVRDNGNGYWSDLYIKFYWGDSEEDWDRIVNYGDKYLGSFENIYSTKWSTEWED